jgi:hypothetical protein
MIRSDDGSFDPLDSTNLASRTANVAASAARISALLSNPVLSAAGGLVRFSVEGFTTGSINSWNATLLPAYGTPFTTDIMHNGTEVESKALAAAFAAQVKCSYLKAESQTVANCRTKNVFPGEYYLALQYGSATYIFASTKLKAELSISSITPSYGSIGGGTLLTITGG